MPLLLLGKEDADDDGVGFRRQPKRPVSMRTVKIVLLVVVIFLIVAIIIGAVVGSRRSEEPSYLHIYPRPDPESDLIRFVQGIHTSYRKYEDNLNEKLKAYRNKASHNMVNCSSLRNRPANKQCMFDLHRLGQECTDVASYGYDEGQPCVLLELKPPVGWKPSSENGNPTDISVRCEGEQPADRENLGEIVYFPPTGFPKIFFPNTGQTDYLAPLVMVWLKAPQDGVIMRVQCRAFVHNAPQQQFQGTFEMMVE